MPTIDPSRDESIAKGKLTKLQPRRSGGKEDELFADLELTFEVKQNDVAKIERFAPGVRKLWRAGVDARQAIRTAKATEGAGAGSMAAGDGTFGDLVIKLPESSRNIRIRIDTDSGPVEGGGEIRGALRFRSTPKLSTITFKVRMAGLNGEAIGHLADMLDMLVDTGVRRVQKVLNFNAVPRVGAVVSGVDDGAEYAGVVVSAYNDDGVAMLLVKDIVDERRVRSASVSGALDVIPPDGRLLCEVLDEYVDSASECDCPASWRFLVVALGQRYLEAGASEKWVLDGDVIDAALQQATAA